MVKKTIRKPVKRKTPVKTADREIEFSTTVAKVIGRCKGKRYTVGLVRELAQDLQNAVVDFCSKEPSFDERINELRKQLHKKAVLVSPHGANRHRGCFFVESVEREVRAGCTDTVRISGILYTPDVSDGMNNGYLRPINYYFGITSTCVREGSLRTTYGGEYYSFPICTMNVYEQYRSLAREKLKNLKDRISKL